MKYVLSYSDGKQVLKEFENEKEAAWYIHNEGDHLVYAERYIDEQWDPKKHGTGPLDFLEE